jgi:hypothetical protein
MEPGQDILPDDVKKIQHFDDIHFNKRPLWEAILGMLVVGVLYAALPSKLLVGPGWILIIVEIVLLLPIAVTLLTGRGLPITAIRPCFFGLFGLLTAAEILSIVLLVTTLSTDKYALYLLRAAAILWTSNILIFGLWYWQIDGGGPLKRHLSDHQAADFMFPQQTDGNTRGWVPHFLDYLFLAFTASTALSPADTFPLSRSAKSLMMVEALISMTIIVLLAARAVNIFS